MTARTCGCGMDISGKGPYVTQCGRCSKARIMAARADQHVYARTHVHEWPDGSRTIELGTRCEGTCHE